MGASPVSGQVDDDARWGGREQGTHCSERPGGRATGDPAPDDPRDGLRRLCRERFAGDDTKEFRVLEGRPEAGAPLVLSLDVIYHLVEDAVFEEYMRRLFDASERFVIVYSSDLDSDPSSSVHVRHQNTAASA